MHKFAAALALFALAACGGSSRSDECEIADCDQATVDACITSVEACEDVGGPLEGTCIDAVIATNDLACGLDDIVDTGA